MGLEEEGESVVVVGSLIERRGNARTKEREGMRVRTRRANEKEERRGKKDDSRVRS